jgi:iron(III) transport system substrate-binding protein
MMCGGAAAGARSPEVRMPPARTPRTVLAALLAGWAGAAAGQGQPAESDPSVVAAAAKEGKVVVYSTTDSVAAQPLLREFRARYPGIEVEYDDMNSTELYNRFVSEAAAGAGTADLLWSSSMDLQIKLVSDGYASEYASPAAPRLPPWAIWRNQAYGTTFEPIGFAYNKRLLKPEEVPQSHADLARAVRANPGRWGGKLCSYDPERSGLGFLLITQDAAADSGFSSTLGAYGLAQTKVYTSTGAMLEKIISGEHLLGFNMIGSYVLAKAKKDPNVGFVTPKDYTLVMSRIAILPKAARHPNAGRLFLDFVLSQAGQEVIARKADLFAIRAGVTGEFTAAQLQSQLGDKLRPIPVGPELLGALDQKKRLAFLRQWQETVHPAAAK